jgi:NAD(P)-dependent dehydrogenase (short-subunit alcohol dehydrogenase family)
VTAGLDSRVALITGAGGGIGAATARVLAGRGCRVGITYRDRREAAERLAEEIGGRAFPFDLRERSQVAPLVEAVERELGVVQILVHNAGLIRDRLLPFLAEEDWDEIHEVNLKGGFRLTKALIKGMLGRRWGRVIAITSVSGIIGQLGQTHYSSAKAGMIAFVKALARETASYGVTANAIAPGFIDTDLLQAMPQGKLEEYLAGIPLRRLGKPEEVAELVAYLASDAAGYVTGQTFRIDGGLVMS